MAHEELKKQFEKDRKIHGNDAFRLWEYQDYGCSVWEPCWQEPYWQPYSNYRRKEPSFVPEYFSGLNWRDALPLVGQIVETVEDPDHFSWIKSRLESIRNTSDVRKFKIAGDGYFPYIRTCPDTFQHPTITMGGVELPRPEVKSPKKGTPVWIVEGSSIKTQIWSGTWNYEHEILKDGKIHLTESRAQAWADWWKNTVMAAVKGGE